MMTVDRIAEAARTASRGNAEKAEQMLLAISKEGLIVDSDKDAWRRAWRSVQEHKSQSFYGRHNQ
jgi:hypothetical protein